MTLTDSEWWSAVWISTLIMVITVAVEFVLGMALAMIMNKIIIPRRTLRTIVLTSRYSIITVVSAYGWFYAFLTDQRLRQSVRLHTRSPAAGSPVITTGSATLVVAVRHLVSEIWKTTPFMSLLLLAGLAQVPGELDEAAEVDGATCWQRLWR